MAVDAPTLYDIGLKTHEKIIPPNDETKYKVISFQEPNPFSSPEPITTVEIRVSTR